VGYDFETMAESTRRTQLNGARVDLHEITRSFAGRQALSPISFSLEAGEFVSLLGPSGSGKSTLLRMIAGLETQDSGSLVVTGGESRSFVFQDAALIPWRTVLENVALPLEISRRSIDAGGGRAAVAAFASIEDRACEALAKVGLADAARLYPNQLSGGMKMRVSVARAIVSNPSLLLLDEPFAALDERTRCRLQEDLRALWSKLGMTIVFVTHSTSEAVFVSNRTIVLSPGPGARVLTDRRIDLGAERAASLRSDPRYLNEIAHLNEAFDSEVARSSLPLQGKHQ
jgi:NitT/TauT family transport system ATP-binding protein